MDVLFAENFYLGMIKNIINNIIKHKIKFLILLILCALISFLFIAKKIYFEENLYHQNALKFHGPKGKTYEISSVVIKNAFTGHFVTKKKNKTTGIHIDKEKFPVTGIDISKHSGVISWHKVDKQNISFAYIKATEGGDYIDPKYDFNIASAKKTKIKLGDYHFFRFDPTGTSQAKNYLKHRKTDDNDLSPVIDIEEWGNYPVTIKNAPRLKKQIKDFITEVEEATCKKLIIYTNLSTYNKLIKGDFKDHEVWICSFQKNTQLPDRQWLFWQHSHSGKLDGVPGLVDFNTFNGDETAWCEYAHEN